MPYNHFTRDGKECVYKVDEEGKPVGKSLGCHDTVEKAVKQIAAIKISEEKVSSFIEHHGVKGMKWGVRRRRQAGTSSGTSTDAAAVAKLKGRRIGSLSNKQLKAVNDRLNLEKQYRSLNPTKTDKAKKLVGDILGNAAKQALTEASKNIMSAQLKKLIESKSAGVDPAKAISEAAAITERLKLATGGA